MKKGAAFAGQNSAALVAGGAGEVGEKLEETELYPFVGSNGVGATGFEVAGNTVEAAGLCCGGGAPTWWRQHVRDRKHHGDEGNITMGLVVVEGEQRRALHGGL